MKMTEPLIKTKMRLLVKKGHEHTFNRLFDEFLTQKETILTEIVEQNLTEELRYNSCTALLEELFCNYNGVTNASIYEVTRFRPVMQTRQLMMWAIKTSYPNITLSKIARRYGKDHATVLHAQKAVSARLETDKFFKHSIEEIINQIKEQGYNYESDAMIEAINHITPLYK